MPLLEEPTFWKPAKKEQVCAQSGFSPKHRNRVAVLGKQ